MRPDSETLGLTMARLQSQRPGAGTVEVRIGQEVFQYRAGELVVYKNEAVLRLATEDRFGAEVYARRERRG